MQEHLKTLLDTFSKIPSREEFVSAFKAATDLIKREISRIEAKIDQRLAQVRDGRDGVDGKDGRDGARGPQGERGPQGLPGFAVFGAKGADGKDGKDGSPDTPEQVRDKLETLKDDERLDVSAVKGLEKLEERVRSVEIRPTTVAGRSLLQLYVDGSKKGAIQYLNLVAGSNVTLTYNRSNGRNDVTISSTGGNGAFSVLTATGDVNDTNVDFTFASEPTLVVVNGTAYRDGKGVTISGTSVTLDAPAGAGGDVYGLG